MTNDPTIREQSYHYFLQEAPELLQALEQELLSLREDYSINKVYTLMRIAHTLKGAAATVGLETIKTVTHSLEDIFKALCKPGLSIDPEVEALLLEGYECLRLSVTSALTQEKINDVEILDRTAAVFASLQEKLGDCFGQDAYLPSSEELGFDVTQSIFELGVTTRLQVLAAALASADRETIALELQTQAEVFFGLAESLNLPGFGAIARSAIAALNAHPEQAVTIARAALFDFQEAQKAVLNGDRISGGQPSRVLQHLSGLPFTTTELVVNDAEFSLKPDSPQDPLLEAYESVHPVDPEVRLLSELQKLDLGFHSLHKEESANPLFDLIWGGAGEHGSMGAQVEENVENDEHLEYSDYSFNASSQEEPVTDPPPPIPTKEAIESTSISHKDQMSHNVRVNVEHLEYLNYSIGELLTNQNRQSLQNEQLLTAVRVLLTQLQQHQQRLGQLRDLSKRLFKTKSRQTKDSEFQILVCSLLEDTVQLTEASDAIDLFARSSKETLEKQRRLLTSTHDTLLEARMLPLGDIFGRFPRLLHHLELLHKKLVLLEVNGNEVLVDKVVAEKLFDPLLHLIRNAFHHGIESPTIRLQQGKQETGQIELRAYNRDTYLIIEVQDDGQGLDFEKIRATAVERQIVSTEVAIALNEAQLTDLLFEPGFSTSTEVNDLSGRGIGLDVVRTQLQALGGLIEVYSQRHQGTKFILQIPLSLTIAKLLLCQADNRIYAFFTHAIEQIIIPQAQQIRAWSGGKVLRLGKGADEKLIPIYQLSKVMNYSWLPNLLVSQPTHPIKQQMPVTIVRYQDKLVGLEVDQMIGEQELVIRPLGQMIVPPNYIYGGSILADGQLTLVLNGVALIQHVLNQQTDGMTDSLSYYTNAARLTASSTPSILSNSQQQRQLPAQRASLPPAPHTEFKAIQDKIILVVDDSITVRQNLVMTLQKAGYQVLQAEDGYKALEQLRFHKRIDLVICDIEMPQMNGFELLKYLKQDVALANIPVVMLTSRSGKKHRTIASKFGATAYITKPYMEHHLLTTVKDVLANNVKNFVTI